MDPAAATGPGPSAIDPLFITLYAELRRLAGRDVWRQGAQSPVSATTLLHEAYLQMARREPLAFPDAPRFLAYAARVMRGLVIDRVRERDAAKRGGGLHITSLDTQHGDVAAASADGASADDLQALAVALDELARLEPELATVVELKYFCGFDLGEVAALLQVSGRTVQRRWEKARMALHLQLSRAGAG
jgi:RNA polymerase sigma factor (TIGR02999 family)